MSDIELSKALHERVYEKIRDSIGDLMSDDDLKLLVDKAANKAFFEDREIQDGYHKRTVQAPMIEEISKLLKSQVNEQIKVWLKDNPAIIEKALQDALAKGMMGLVEQYFANLIRMEMSTFQSQLQTALTQPRY